MTNETAPPERADIIKRDVEKGYPLDGDVYSRIWRSLSGLLSYNVEQIQRQGPRVSLRSDVGYEALLVDASAAPFRRNGKAWTFARNLAAQATFVNIITIVNVSKSALVMLDAIVYGGASVVQVAIFTDNVGPGVAPLFPLVDIESRPSTSLAAGGAPSRPKIPPATALIPGIDAFLNAAAATPSALGDNIAVLPSGGPGPFPIGDVLWPGEVAEFAQATVNVAWPVTIYGRIWDFGDGFAALGSL